MSQTRRLGNSLKDNPFIKRDPRWTPTAEKTENPLERRGSENLLEQRSPTPKARGRSFTPKEMESLPAAPANLEGSNDDGRKQEAVVQTVKDADAAPREESAPIALSAAAPSFSPSPAPIPDAPSAPPPEAYPAPPPPPADIDSAPPPDTSSFDTFTQTGAAQDDLFDDITPVDDSMRVRSEEDLFGDDFTPLAQPVVEEPAPAPQPVRTRADGQRGRGRGRGRARGAQSRGGGGATTAEPHTQPNGESQPQDRPIPPEDAPSGPRKDTHPSVRGDRRATGGNLKPKLTEAELAEKMARIQIKNASLTAAHARAEADAASFAEREEAARAKAAQKQKAERRDRQQMMGEREKNRQRKLKAMEGREWDAEKEERDFGKGGRFDGKGFAGDREGCTDGREYLYREPRGERRAGRERERQERPPRQEEFPALPAVPKQAGGDAGSANASAATAGKSWADQVEAGVPS